MQVQLDFFVDKTEIEILQDEIRDLRLSQDKMRKSLFAKHGELSKKYIELHNRLQVLESNICKGKWDVIRD